MVLTKEPGTEDTEPFKRRQLLYHAAKGKKPDIRELTRDVGYLTQRCRDDGIEALLEDLRVCEAEMPGVLDLTDPPAPEPEPELDEPSPPERRRPVRPPRKRALTRPRKSPRKR